MNIVLIGYRGTGKSSVAGILADRLGWKHISTDAEIIVLANSRSLISSRHSAGTISEIWRATFAATWPGATIWLSTPGAGRSYVHIMLMRLKGNGRLFWLTAEIPTIAQRIGGDTQRPSLTGTKSFVEEIAEVLAERRPQYSAAAHHVIPTDHVTVMQVADSILALL